MKKIIIMAMAKGIVHATLIPIMIFVLTNSFIEGKWGGITALTYMVMVYVLYNFVFKNKDISKVAFNWTFLLVVFVPLVLKLMQALSYGLAG